MMDVLFTTLAFICLVRASISTTWLRLREDDVITGTHQTTRMVTFARSQITCAHTCSLLDWCSVFAADDLVGTCELRDLPRVSLNFSSLSPYSNHWGLLSLYEWCPVDAGFLCSAAANFCFIVVTNLTANWTQSKNECKRRGLDLVVLDTTLKLNIVLKTIKSMPGSSKFRYFLGAIRPIGDLNGIWNGDIARFDWINGEPIRFTKDFWAVGQPNSYGGGQNCLVVEGPQGALLNDYDCYIHIYFVCEKSEQIR